MDKLGGTQKERHDRMRHYIHSLSLWYHCNGDVLKSLPIEARNEIINHVFFLGMAADGDFAELDRIRSAIGATWTERLHAEQAEEEQ